MSEEAVVDFGDLEVQVRAEMRADGTAGSAPAPDDAKADADDSADDASADAGDSSDDVDGSEDEQDDTDDAPAPVEEKQKKKSSYIPRARFDEVNQRNAELKKEREDALREIEELKALIRKEFAGESKGEEQQELDADVIDEATYKKVTQLEQKIQQKEAQEIVRDFQRDESLWEAKIPNYKEICNEVINYDANNIMERAEAAGIKITPADARNAAIAAIPFAELHKNGKSYGKYFLDRATMIVGKVPAPKEKKGANVDIKKLDGLRKSAAAPTNNKSFDATSFSISDLEKEVRKEMRGGN